MNPSMQECIGQLPQLPSRLFGDIRAACLKMGGTHVAQVMRG